MISFHEYIAEISSVDMPQINSSQGLRNYSKISPDSSKFNIIPIRLGYDTYNVFKRYSNDNKFRICDRLLDRRGETVDWKTVFASNEEIANLKELANYIINNSEKPNEQSTAVATLERINELEDKLATSW